MSIRLTLTGLLVASVAVGSIYTAPLGFLSLGLGLMFIGVLVDFGILPGFRR